MPIEQGRGGVMITGNAINWYAALSLKHAIQLYQKTGIKIRRGMGPKALCEAVGTFTGARYARGAAGLEQARTDIAELVATQPDRVARRAPQAAEAL